MIRCPWWRINISIYKNILQRCEKLLRLWIILIGKFVINIILQLIFIFDKLLNFIAVINGIFENFFNLRIIGIKSYFTLIRMLVGIYKEDDHMINISKVIM